jgi:type I restriction enzyme S subunit
MNPERLLALYDRISEAPNSVARLRRFVLDLAIRGKLVEQDSSEEPAPTFLDRIASRWEQLASEGTAKRRKLMPAPEPDSLPFELPPGWKWVSLGELGTVASSSRVHQADWRGAGVPFYRAREIVKLSEFGRVENELFISENLYSRLATNGYTPQKADLMITGVGTIGIPYVVRSDDRFYFKDASVLIFKNWHVVLRAGGRHGARGSPLPHVLEHWAPTSSIQSSGAHYDGQRGGFSTRLAWGSPCWGGGHPSRPR